MAYPPPGHQPPSPPGGPAPGPQYGYQAPPPGQQPHMGQPPYGNQPPPGSQPQYPGQPSQPGHSFPAPGQYNPHVMPPTGGKSGSSGVVVAAVVGFVLLLLLGGAGAAFFLLSDGSSSTNTDSDSEPETVTDPDGTEHEARFSIGNGPEDAPEVVIFADYNCGGCQEFDYEYGNELRAAAHHGEIQLDIVTINLTGVSTDPDDFSSQAATVAACFYEADPDGFGDFHGDVMQKSFYGPDTAISIEEMISIASTSSIGESVEECFDHSKKADHADISTAYATNNSVTAVPTIWVDEVVTQPEDVMGAISS